MPLLVSAVIYHGGNKLKKEQSGRINLTEPAEFRQFVRESLAEAVIYNDINRYRDEEIAVRGHPALMEVKMQKNCTAGDFAPASAVGYAQWQLAGKNPGRHHRFYLYHPRHAGQTGIPEPRQSPEPGVLL